MRYAGVCLMALAMALPAAGGGAAEPASASEYSFTANGLPLVPRVISLRDDPEHPAPGDLLAVGDLLLTLGPERDCRLMVTFKDHEVCFHCDRVFLRLPDGRQRLVGVRVFTAAKLFGETAVVDPLRGLSADEIHALWGVYLDTWSEELAEELRHIDPARTCVTLARKAAIERNGKATFPPLPRDLKYLSADNLDKTIEDYEPLRQWTGLRFLRLGGAIGETFDARWLAHNRALRRLEISHLAIDHLEALSRLEALESLRLVHIPTLVTAEFAAKLPNLRGLDLTDTAVWNVAEDLGNHKTLARLNLRQTRVRDQDLSLIGAKQLQSLDISETMVRDLAPLGRLQKLTQITAVHSMVDRLPTRPMPALRSLTVIATPLAQATADEFAAFNSACAVMRRWTDALRRATAGATRLRIRSGGPGHESETFNTSLMPLVRPAKTLAQINGAAEIGQFVRLIEVDEQAWEGDDFAGDCLEHGPTMEFYRGDRLLATVGWTAVAGLCWPRPWPMLEEHLTPQSLERTSKWLAGHGCAALAKRARRAAAAGDAAQDAAALSCYPERARKLFPPPGDGGGDLDPLELDDEQVERAGAEAERKRTEVARIIGNPVDLAVITCRAMGALPEGPWSTGETGDFVVEAGVDVDGPNFRTALGKLRGDRQAELGAARLFFGDERYRSKIPPRQQPEWTLRLAPILLNRGEWRAVLGDLFQEDFRSDPKIAALLRQIARGEVGRDGQRDEGETGLRARTYRMLAERRVGDVKPEIERLLEKTRRKPDVAALEIALALLGDPKHLRREHLLSGSAEGYESAEGYADTMDNVEAALRAIERFNGRAGLDILLAAVVDDADDSVQERSLLLFQKITGQHWYDPKRDLWPRDCIGDVKTWWRDHGAEFTRGRSSHGSASNRANRNPNAFGPPCRGKTSAG